MAQTPSLNCLGKSGAQAPAISIYLATGAPTAAGTNIPADVADIATANSPVDLHVPRDCVLTDFVCEVDATLVGSLELYSNGMPTGIRIPLAAHQADNTGRPRLSIPLGAGKTYRFRAASALTVA